MVAALEELKHDLGSSPCREYGRGWAIDRSSALPPLRRCLVFVLLVPESGGKLVSMRLWARGG